MKISIQDAKEFFEKHPNNTTPNFKKNHQAPVLRILKDCLDVKDDIVACLSNPREVIDKIKAKYQNPNTVKYYLQALLFFVDQYPELKQHVDRQKYFDFWQASKIIKAEEDKVVEPKQNIEYQDVQEKVYEKFGENSQEAIFIDFYKEAPVRLDFYDIHIYKKTKDLPQDLPDKYLNLETGRLFMKNYKKTAKKYGDKEIYLSADLMDKIKYNLKHHPRDMLFQFRNKDPSSAVKNLLKKAGFPKASMNDLRHSVHSQEMSAEERVEMARRSGHAPTTSVAYKRPSEKVVKMDVPHRFSSTIKAIISELKSSGDEN